MPPQHPQGQRWVLALGKDNMYPDKMQSFGYHLTAMSAAPSAMAPGWPGTQPFPAAVALDLAIPQQSPRSGSEWPQRCYTPRNSWVTSKGLCLPWGPIVLSRDLAPASHPARTKPESLWKVSSER